MTDVIVKAFSKLRQAAGGPGRRLRESEELNRAIFNTVIDGIITIDERGVVVRFNPAAEKIFGYGRSEIIGRKVNMLMPEPYRTEHDTYLDNYLSTGRKKIIGIGREVRGRRKDGSEFPIDLAVSEMRLDGRRMFTGIIRDITERKKAAEEISKLASIVASSSEAIIGEDMEGVIMSWNGGAERLYGYSAREAIGRHVSIIVPEDKMAELEELFRKVRAGEIVQGMETVRRHKDGRLMDVSLTISPIKDPSGQVAGFSAISHDITARKQLERQKADFHAMVTHDIKSPLTVILGYTEFMLTEKELDGDVREMLASIDKNSRKIQRMIEEFMTITRLETDRYTLSLKPNDIAGMVEGLAEQFGPVAAGKGLTLTAYVEDGLPELHVDKRYLSRALSNLVENAVNYTPRGGRVVVRAVRSGADGSGKVCISVEDTGVGVPAEETGKIFQKYYRSPKTSGIKGSGLGLAIVKAIVEGHGGSVEVKSEPGVGSTFSVYLPAETGAPGLAPAA